MTEREALKLALEALKELVEKFDSEQFTSICELDPAKDAIAAAEEALAQPEQEPVEWGVDWGPDGNSVSIIKRLAGGGIEVVGWEYAPHPPQRTWVWLSSEEEKQIKDNCTTVACVLKAVKAKLKEKNK